MIENMIIVVLVSTDVQIYIYSTEKKIIALLGFQEMQVQELCLCVTGITVIVQNLPATGPLLSIDLGFLDFCCLSERRTKISYTILLMLHNVSKMASVPILSLLPSPSSFSLVRPPSSLGKNLFSRLLTSSVHKAGRPT